MLRAVRQILHGPLPERWAALKDANALARIPFVLLLTALLALGCWPRLMTDKIEPSARLILSPAMKQMDAKPVKKKRGTALATKKVKVSKPAKAVPPPGAPK